MRSGGWEKEAWRVQNRSLEGSKSRSGWSFEQLGTVWTILRASEAVLEAFWNCLGGVLDASWGARRPSLGRLGDISEAPQAILGRLGASNGDKIRHSILHVVC